MPNWKKQDYEEYLARKAMRLNPSHSELPSSKSECDKASALGKTVEGKTQSMGRPVVRFIFYRTRLLDQDNNAAGVKDLLDGLRRASLIAGDSEGEVTFTVEQIKVSNRLQRKTVIEIVYP